MPFNHLLKPVNLGGDIITLRNGVVMSALTRNRSIPTNVPNDINVEYYEQRAAGGAGLIVSEGTLITQQGFVLSSESKICTSIDTDNYIAARNGRMPQVSGIKSMYQAGQRSQKRCTSMVPRCSAR